LARRATSRPPEVVLRFAVPVVFPAELARSLRAARVVGIIPSRYRSTRLPGKPLALIGDKPMIEHVYRRASAARSVDAVVVATDDERVADAVAAFGGLAVMTRADHATGTDRLAEVAAALDCSIVINIQGDEPMMSPDAIDAAAEPLLGHPDARMSTLRKQIDHPDDLAATSVVKVVVDRQGYALYFTRTAVPFVRDGHPVPVFWRHLGLYVYRRDFLLTLATLPQTPLELAEGLEQLRVLEHGYRIATVETTADAIGVDTPDDLAHVRRLMSAGVHS
jgi:3-deoxy-manno-octulosonate cytidylyltransferase (CMP-KDO synthetase)